MTRVISPPPRRVADEHGVAQVELLDQLGKVACVGVHVVALPRLARTTVAAAIVRDRPKPVEATNTIASSHASAFSGHPC
jgi:hypothetical protein